MKNIHKMYSLMLLFLMSGRNHVKAIQKFKLRLQRDDIHEFSLFLDHTSLIELALGFELCFG
jgi:hypothetical protein